MLTVKLSARGNPDFGQPRSIGVSTRTVEVADFAAASAACMEYIRAHDLGGGNWTGGEVRDGGKVVARVSYNGRVWGPGKWKVGDKPIWPVSTI